MELKEEIRYIVTKESDDGTFEKDDHIMLNKDGTISCFEEQAWVDKENVPESIKGMEFKIDKESASSKIKILTEKIKTIQKDYELNSSDPEYCDNWDGENHECKTCGIKPEEGWRNTHDKECEICNEIINNIAGNPYFFGISLPYRNGNGNKKYYHQGCIAILIEKYYDSGYFTK